MPNEEQLLGYLKRVTGELHQTRQRLREAESEERDPIAIVGMACRYPGGVSSPEDLWGLVAEGTDAIGDFPDDRGWDTGALYDADPDRPGTSYVRQGGFLTGAGEFDAGLFGISPREALAMDPQQRLMLELAWEAFERAGLAPDSLEGRSVGVFVGSGGQDYFDDLSADAMGEAVERYLSTGNAAAVLSGRVSYTFGLQGPAVTIDTACSSSLVALHTAVRSLRQKECSLALAGGVMVMSTPSPFVAFSRQRGLAADGRCKSFSDGADGTGWSEGAGVLLVERLSDARRLRHPVLAVVRGSAVNQDGASNGMTAPNGPAQQRVIRQALADAGLRAADVDVVEGHGTGTTLGDPIEAQALLATYGQDRGEGAGRPLWLGSVKSNLGHTQAAAGVAGVIKMVMAMRQGVLPRTLHVDAPSGQVDWSAGRVELLTESAPWPVGDRPRRAGVSSFGVSGTNAHVILEQAEDEDDDTYLDGEDRPTESASVPPSGTTPVPLPVSGRDATALSAQAAGLIKHLTNGSQHDLTDVGYALGTTRAALEHRAVVLAPDLATAERGLTAVSLTHDDPAVVRGVVGEGLTGFVFSGQGSGWWGVGRELYGVFPVFAAAFDAVCVELDPLVGGSLREVLWSPDAPEAAGSMWVQAGLFAVQVGLFRLWESWGVVPDVVAGHSVGELAAAHCAGVWSLADACRVVAARGRLMDGLPTGGVMAAVAVSETDIEPWLSDGGVSLAAVNGPSSVVVSGARPDVEPVVAHFEARGVSVRWLEVAHGFHSALMEPMLAEFRAVLDQITFSTTQLGAVSTVTGGSAVGEWSSPDYWVRQVREPVRFADAVQELEAQGVGRFVELGPGSVLSGLVSGCVQNPGSTVVASLRGGRGEVESVTLAAARLHVVGQRLDWEGFFTGREGRARRPRRVELPTYAFQRQRYWLDRRNGLDNPSSLGLDSAGHPFLGAFTVVADSGVTVLTGRLSTESLPWLADHTVHGDILLPGTAFVELAIRAGDQVACEGLEELALHAPLVLTEGGAVRIQVVVGAPEEAGARTVGIYAYDERDSHEPVWTLHADGVLVPKGRIADFELGSWPPADAEPVGLDGLTDALAAAGLAYGAAFQGLRAVWRRDEEIFAEVRLPSDGAHPHEAERFALHPAVLDAGTQALQTVDGGAEQDAETGTVRLPFSWSGVSVYATGADSLRMRFTPRGQDTFSIAIADVAGAPVASVDSVTFRPAAATSPAQAGAEESVYRLKWVPSTSTPALTPASIPASSSASLTPPRTAPPTTAEYDELSAAATVPELVLLRSAEPADGPGTAEEVGAAVHRVLEAIQHWLDDERFTSSTLAVCTRDAAPVGGSGTAADLAAAAVWGLVRSAQAEHPGRFVLVDVDSSDDPQALPRAAAAVVATGEPQGAVRDGLVYAPRLAHGPGAEETDVPTRQPADFDTHGTVLLTGASGAVGGAVARHLVTRHDVRHLVLPGRRGAEAPGLAGLVKELADLGAEITTPVCDVGDRQAVADLLAGIPAERPLTAVLHAAGVLDDGVVTEMTPERIDAVLRPKVYGALNLHDLTRDHDLTHFVLFSSVSGLFGAPGQSNYAAANTFLDGLAELRRAQGLPGQSMAWGPWSTEGGMTAGLDDGARTRIRRSGVLPTSVRTGLALFDAALASPVATVVPISVDAEALRTRPGTLPVAFRGLAAGDRKPSSRRKAATLSSGTGAVDSDGDGGGGVEPGTLAARLADLAQEERAQTLEDLVRSEVASVLGHGSAAAVDPQREFHQLGFDSLMAVELRNTLSAATAMRLPATLVFDYPTVTSLADHLLAELIGTPDPLDRPATPATPKKTDEDPIAIVGMACRYPGGVSSPEDLWRLVAEGTDAIGDFPDDRGWDLDRLHDPKAERPDTSYVREGGFLLDAGDFDAGFFGIPPREAATVDPQQRLLLETSWEALERAGIDPLSLKGSSTGVFAGIQYHDYAGSASTGSIASGRIAYTLGLEGPAISVDTACSSSLVAMHWASRSLRAGECSLALAGGVTVMATPETFVEFSRQNGLSKDARCKAYSGTADGTAWSEGVGMVVLERLSDARRLGHPVLAVVRGSAVNQDGASNGMTAPNGPAQQRVIRQALADARVSGDQVDVVEGHGTGTTLGDPIEAQALLA
uniref:SDR family NAD(P)-dependent oxidoreductase n=1 Tax=Streptomyces sp. PA5.6 TaxID=3035651 RepID=UPI003904CC43